MITSRKIQSLLVFAALLQSCASISGYPDRSEDLGKTLASLQEKYFLPNVNVIEKYERLGDPQEKQSYRNEVVAAHMRAIDINFSEFRRHINKEGNLTSLSFGFLGATVGAAGTAVTGAAASRILSALSAVVATERTDIDKTLYLEKALPALFATMEAERTKVRVDIERGLTLNTADYTLAKALSDLERYYNAGSLPGAFASITTTAGRTKQKGEKEIVDIQKAKYVAQAAQQRVKAVLAMAEKLDNTAALEIVTNPPSPLDEYTLNAVKRSLRGNRINSLKARNLMNEGTNAKKILKMILSLINDRSQENLAKWVASITARVSNK